MKKYYISLLLPMLTCAIRTCLASSKSAYQTIVTIEAVKTGNLETEKEIFVKAFKNAYKDVPPKALNIKNMDELFNTYFENQRADLKDTTKKVTCTVAKTKEQTAGFIIFEQTNQPGEVYVRLLAVDPNLQKQGIGEQLMTSIRITVPSVRSVILAVRKINLPAYNFCKKLGFKALAYVPGGLTPERYIGLQKDTIEMKKIL